MMLRPGLASSRRRWVVRRGAHGHLDDRAHAADDRRAPRRLRPRAGRAPCCARSRWTSCGIPTGPARARTHRAARGSWSPTTARRSTFLSCSSSSGTSCSPAATWPTGPPSASWRGTRARCSSIGRTRRAAPPPCTASARGSAADARTGFSRRDHSPGDDVRPFQAGAFFAIARERGEVSGRHRLRERGRDFGDEPSSTHMKRLARTPRIRVAVVVGAPILASGRSVTALCEQAQVAVQELVWLARARLSARDPDIPGEQLRAG